MLVLAEKTRTTKKRKQKQKKENRMYILRKDIYALRDPRIGCDYQALLFFAKRRHTCMLCSKMILMYVVHYSLQSTLECLGSSHLYHVCTTFETVICIHPFQIQCIIYTDPNHAIDTSSCSTCSVQKIYIHWCSSFKVGQP